MSAVEKFNRRAESVNSLLCVGLDSDYRRLPERFKSESFSQFAFNQWIIEQTHEWASAYKLNMAFYEARGDVGLRELNMTMAFLQSKYGDVLTICDAKRGDIDSTNQGYVTAIFDWLGFDAVTLHPYLGQEALQPFLQRKDKGCMILCRTSNPGAGELQDLEVGGKRLWQVVAERVCNEWNGNGNCMLVVGGTYPEDVKCVRGLVGEMTLLVPGLGTQGGDVEQTVRAGLNSDKMGMIINASRSIIFAENPGEAARQLRDEINFYR